MDSAAAFRFDNSFARELPGFYVPWRPAVVSTPRLLFFNHSLAAELCLDVTSLDGPAAAATFAGNTLPDGAAAIELLANRLKPSDVVLVKASRAAQLEGVASALLGEAGQ